MEKCKKMLRLFNKRIKFLYLNGYTKFQILNELKVFYDLEDSSYISKIDIDNNIYNKETDYQLDRKIHQHFSKELYFSDRFDSKFSAINKINTPSNIDNFEEFKLIDELLENPRIPFANDITLSCAISIYEKPFNGITITKDSYLELISSISEDCISSKNEEIKEDDLILFENAFKYLKYSILNIEDRIEIYQELTILLSKLATIYNLEDEVFFYYFNLFGLSFLKDLVNVNNVDYILKVMKSIYSNTSFNSFLIILPFFVENFSYEIINSIIVKFDNDIFIKKDNNFSAIFNTLIFNSANKKLFSENINSNMNITKFEKDLSLLEFAINFEDKETVYYYWDKIKLNDEFYLYQDLLEDVSVIVKNFDRIEYVENKIKKINIKNFNEVLIDVEKLNYLNRKVYSCAINRICHYFIDSKSFNFYFLLLLISLNLDEKIITYFYNNIKYLNMEKPKDIFIHSNMLFLLNYFDFSVHMLSMLEKEITKNDKMSSLFYYIILELDLIKDLIISANSNKKIEDILTCADKKGIV